MPAAFKGFSCFRLRVSVLFQVVSGRCDKERQNNKGLMPVAFGLCVQKYKWPYQHIGTFANLHIFKLAHQHIFKLGHFQIFKLPHFQIRPFSNFQITTLSH
jgi:hypothetical protein